MPGKQGGKGKSRASDKRKAYMAHTRATARDRRRDRKDAQNERHRTNLATIKAGGETPWQLACKARHTRRHPLAIKEAS